MTDRLGKRNKTRGKSLFSATLAMVFVVMLLAGLVIVPALIVPAGAQAPAAPAQLPPPQWQVDAGGKMEFDVVSVKPDTAEPSRTTVNTNIPLGPMDAFSPTGGLLSSTNFPLLQYILFAYKLDSTQVQSVQSQLPKWANTNRYDIQGKVAGNPTKDQFRLMMQALLADRFKLAIHYETKQLPVYALVLDKPGKLGPQLQKHPDDQPCSTAIPASGDANAPAATAAGGFPANCGALAVLPSKTPGRVRAGARNLSLSVFAGLMNTPQLTGVDRPVLDRTGLTGKYDFFIEFTPMINGPLPPGANFTPDPNGPTFLEALKEQLGIKLESQTGPVDSIVVDHVEQPSEN
jgi:uncharacterized protein (TIGR03435 family)